MSKPSTTEYLNLPAPPGYTRATFGDVHVLVTDAFADRLRDGSWRDTLAYETYEPLPCKPKPIRKAG